MEAKNKTLKQVFDEFITHCNVKNLASTTLKYYTLNFKYFSRFTDANINIQVIDKQTIEKYTRVLEQNTVCQRILESLRKALCSYIKENYYIFDLFDEVLYEIGKNLNIDFRKFMRLKEIKKFWVRQKRVIFHYEFLLKLR